MDSQKFENILNLALETPEEVREKSLTLNIGFEPETKTWELIVKYNGSLELLEESGIVVEELVAGYGILTVPENLVDAVAAYPAIEYVEKPKRLFFSAFEGKRASCILPVTLRPPNLTGRGVLVAIIDSGIDYSNNNFRKADGKTRILYLWDQSLNSEQWGLTPPEGFSVGVEFTAQMINAALEASSREEMYMQVPSLDVTGHGTAVAGIAAANGGDDGAFYEGVAVESELIVVKLGNPRENSFPRTTELMRALTYVVRKAQELHMPVAINLSFGNTYGAHDGTSLVERFIDNASEIGRNVICIGAGNEGTTAGHVQGRIPLAGNAGSERVSVELAIANYESSVNVQLWKNYVDEYEVKLTSPGGRSVTVPTMAEDMGRRSVIFEDTQVLMYLGQPTPYSAVQEIYFDFIPQGTYINSGIWTFTIQAIRNVTGVYQFYLPSGMARNSNTQFFRPTPELTITIPSTASKVISVGAYNAYYESYADFSGRGFYCNGGIGGAHFEFVKPDIVAPGVNIGAPDVYGGYTTVSGTSFATPFVTGAAALLMEWGIVRGNDPYLYGEKIKAYFRNGAKPIRGESVYPNARVGWGALCVAESLPQ